MTSSRSSEPGDDWRDHVARDAARRLVRGETDEIATAIRLAQRAADTTITPPESLIRRHWQGLMQQATGDAAYTADRQRVRSVIEDALGTLETIVDSDAVRLVGRTARDLIDGPVTARLRVYATIRSTTLAGALEAAGYDTVTVHSADTRFGRLDELRFRDEDVDFVLVRCLPDQIDSADRNLYRDEPIASLTPAQYRTSVLGR